jgi:hypothetical protein
LALPAPPAWFRAGSAPAPCRHRAEIFFQFALKISAARRRLAGCAPASRLLPGPPAPPVPTIFFVIIQEFVIIIVVIMPPKKFTQETIRAVWAVFRDQSRLYTPTNLLHSFIENEFHSTVKSL